MIRNILSDILHDMAQRKQFPNILVKVEDIGSDYVDILLSQQDSNYYATHQQLMQEIESGDFCEWKRKMINLCDWYVEAQCKDGVFRIKYLNSIQSDRTIAEPLLLDGVRDSLTESVYINIMLMKILIIDEKKTRREELASINKEVNNILKNCDQLHILTGNECTSFIEEIRSNKETSHIAKYAIICCHHTFVEKIEDQLKEICRKNSIPLIFFSGRYSYSYMSDNVLQLSVDKFYTQALPCIVQDIKAENPLILEKIEFGEDYEVAILMNTRNKLIEWLEAEDDTQTYSELDLDSYV